MAINISLSPNTQSDDLLIAGQTLCSVWRWSDQAVNNKITRLISSRLHNLPAVLTSSGRTALYHTLAAFGIGPGDEVIVQAFTCLAVPAPVCWLKATPVFADIDLTTYNFQIADVARRITPRTKAIIVQHTFGLAGPVRRLRHLADQHHLKLIEDLSHSFGATYDGQPLGTFGHAAIISFGRDKTISCVFGGAILSSDPAFMQRVQARLRQLAPPPRWWVTQQLLHPLLMSLLLPLYFVGSLGKALLVAAQKMKLLSLAVTAREKAGYPPPYLNWHFSPALGFLLLNQLSKLDRYTRRRRLIARRYFDHLPLSNQLSTSGRPNWLRVPLRVQNRALVLSQAKVKHIILGTWYDQVVTPTITAADPTGYQAGACPQAERAAASTINLPTHPGLSDKQVDQIITFMSSVRLSRT